MSRWRLEVGPQWRFLRIGTLTSQKSGGETRGHGSSMGRPGCGCRGTSLIRNCDPQQEKPPPPVSFQWYLAHNKQDPAVGLCLWP